jgi:UDP-glucose 4-epimerase
MASSNGMTLNVGNAPARFLVTGGAGFIGSNLVDRLLALGYEVTAYDNLSTGRREFLADALRHPSFRFVESDLLDATALQRAMQDQDFVFHLAANADVRFGTAHPGRDLQQNTIATHNVLEAMRLSGVRRIAFSSTGSVYGEPQVFPTPEDCPFPVQTSLYGASKLAAEGLLSAYAEGFGFEVLIFRFVSILGERYSHGHVFDFLKKLSEDPTRIEVLGDGNQRKSYLYVQDCVNAMLLAMNTPGPAVRTFNLGTDEYCTVDKSLDWICAELGLVPKRDYSGGPRGWIGDSPFILLDCSRIRSLGWRPELPILDAVLCTLRYLRQSRWLLESRK